MAKSLRSKFKRKMRSIKRKRVAPRELKRLHATVAKLDTAQAAMDAVKQEAKDVESGEGQTSSQMDTGSTVGLNLKTMRRPDGTFPEWLSQRKVRQMKQKQKVLAKAKKKKAKKTR